MKKFKLLLFTTLLILFSSAYSLEQFQINNTYNKFVLATENKYEIKEQLLISERLNYRVQELLKSNQLESKKNSILKHLLVINTEKINSLLQNDIKLNSIQLEIEAKERNKLILFKNQITIPNYINSIIWKNLKLYYTKVSDNKSYIEFIENDKIKKIVFKKYIEIDSDNYLSLKDKSWAILYYNDKFIFVNDYKIEEKIPYSQAKKHFKFFINKNYNYFIENWNYYWYYFDSSNFINDSYWIYLSSLEEISIFPENTILYTINNKFYFIIDFEKRKLINKNVLNEIKNKDKILSYIYEDKQYYNWYDEDSFEKLKSFSKDLTSWFDNKDQKVQKIYSWVIDNIEYSNTSDFSKKYIFSWIETYKNKSWVCEWYVKLLAYMLFFSWIEDANIIKWYVINAPDFPQILHAWLNIWDFYYDPTFDDPIWNDWNINFSNYVYYKLPYDIFYANRYNIWSLPDSYKTKSKTELQSIVDNQLINLVQKYSNSNYNILKKYEFFYKNNINSLEELNINKLSSIIPIYEASNSNLTYIINWKTVKIKSLKYYTFKENEISVLLNTIKYDISNKIILKWNFSDWSYEYRLVYEITS